MTPTIDLSVEVRLRLIEDRLDVRQLLDRYADAFTRRDWDGVTDCYLPEASFQELPPVELLMRDRKEVIAAGKKYMSSMDHVVMMIHSCVITLDGDCAVARTILHEAGRTVQNEDVNVLGRYEDQIMRRDGRWYFAKRLFQPIQCTFPTSFQESVVAGLRD